MKKFLLYFLIWVTCSEMLAHSMQYTSVMSRSWTNATSGEKLNGSLLVSKDGLVHIQDDYGVSHVWPVQELSDSDQAWLQQRLTRIQEVNAVRSSYAEEAEKTQRSSALFWIALCASASLVVVFWLKRYRRIRWMLRPVLLVILGFAGAGFVQWKNQPVELNTDPAIIHAAFEPFIPAVHTFYDDQYFYVESRGIPETHELMVGISNHGWQQQVPIPQCYVGDNAWPIPLAPVMSGDPIPVDETHFTRGAIAIAVNGVPIFNVHTNTGVDSYVDGQLDCYGGHCGRADDYHYHIAPLHLYDYTQASLPIAYALDGFAVYGATEPDGSAMQALDANHGHVGSDGVYHYHGTTEAPYMIARMAGVVVEDSTHQLVPQAAAHPVRPSLTPLNGALINMCIPNGNGNGYTLGYMLNGQQDSIEYHWTLDGQYTFNYFTTGDGVANTQVYNGFDQCTVPLFSDHALPTTAHWVVFPNPCRDRFTVRGLSPQCNEIRIYDASGRCLKRFNPGLFPNGTVEISEMPSGVYYVEALSPEASYMQKLVKQ